MHKLLVNMKGKYCFIDMTTIPAQQSADGRPFVVAGTPLVQRQVGMGIMTQIKDLPENATDEEWAKFYEAHEGDVATALENFIIALEKGPEGDDTGEGECDDKGEGEPEPQKAPAKKTRAAAKDKE